MASTSTVPDQARSGEEERITIDSLKVVAEIARNQTSYAKLVRVPLRLYQANPEAFTPLFVSMGPFHHIGQNSKLGPDSKTLLKDVNMLAMETQKQACVLDQLEQGRVPPGEGLQRCQNFVQENLYKIYTCYSEKIEISQQKLANIMLVDGCFLLGFLFDVFDQTMSLHVKQDLILLENQIPLFVLLGLHQNLGGDLSSLLSGILRMYNLCPTTPLEEYEQDHVPEEFIHMLDLISKYNIPQKMRVWFLPSTAIHLRSTTKLTASGVTFQLASENKLLDIQFSAGVLRIPPLRVTDYTDTLLMNILAHEHLSPNFDGYFTSYVLLMSHLVESKEDLHVLEKEGIIRNELGSRDDVSKLFSNISKQFVLRNFCYSSLCQKIEAYVTSNPQRHIRVLKKRHFGSPWTALSVVAATVLLLFTTLQTIYTVLSYYH